MAGLGSHIISPGGADDRRDLTASRFPTPIKTTTQTMASPAVSPAPAASDRPSESPSSAFLGTFIPLTSRPIAARVPDWGVDANEDGDLNYDENDPAAQHANGLANGTVKPKKTPSKSVAKDKKGAGRGKEAGDGGTSSGTVTPPFLSAVSVCRDAAFSAGPIDDTPPYLLLFTVQSDGIHGHVPGRGPVLARSVPPGTAFAAPAVFLPTPSSSSSSSAAAATSTPATLSNAAQSSPTGILVAAIRVAPDVPPSEIGRQLWAWQVPSARAADRVKRTLDKAIAGLVSLGKHVLAVHYDGSATVVEASRGLAVKRTIKSPFSPSSKVLWVEAVSLDVENSNADDTSNVVLGSFTLVLRDSETGRHAFARLSVTGSLDFAPEAYADLPATLEPRSFAFRAGNKVEQSTLAVVGGFLLQILSGPTENKPTHLAPSLFIPGRTSTHLFRIPSSSPPLSISQSDLDIPSVGTPLLLGTSHLLLLSTGPEKAIRAAMYETGWGTVQHSTNVALDGAAAGFNSGSFWPVTFGDRIAVAVSASVAGGSFSASLHAASYGVPEKLTIAAALGKAVVDPGADMEGLSAAAAKGDSAAFDIGFAKQFLSGKAIVAESDFPSAYPPLSVSTIPSLVRLAMDASFETTIPRSALFLLRTHLASAHAGGWFPSLIARGDPALIEAALIHVGDLTEVEIALAAKWALGGKLSDEEADEAVEKRATAINAWGVARGAPAAAAGLSAGQHRFLRLILSYPCTSSELVRALRRSLAPGDWAKAWNWVTGMLQTDDLEEGSWLFAEPPVEETKADKKKNKKSQGKRGEEDKPDWLPGPKGEKAMLEKRLALGLEQVGFDEPNVALGPWDSSLMFSLVLLPSFSKRLLSSWTPTSTISPWTLLSIPRSEACTIFSLVP